MKTMVIAPHADDEVLGCAGTLLKRKAEGNQVACIIMTQISQIEGNNKSLISKKNEEVKNVASLMEFDLLKIMNFSPSTLDRLGYDSIIKSLKDIIVSFEPNELLLPHFSDAHSDHRVIFEACLSFCKWFRYPSIKKIMMYETLSETEFGINIYKPFIPNYFVNISQFFKKKLEVCSYYESEIGCFPFPRSKKAISALALLRGATSGYEAAEAFQIIKILED